MRVLFIGGSGTISSACAKKCWETGIDLWVLVRGTRDHRIARKDRIIHGDVKQNLNDVIAKLTPEMWDCVVDWVAFDPGDIARDFKLFYKKTKKFIYISSTSVYRKPLLKIPVTEDAPIGNKFFSEADEKAEAERLLMELYRDNGFPAMIVRPGHVYSDFVPITGIKGMGFGLMDRIMKGKPILVHGDGTGLWSAMYNEDFAEAFVPLMCHEGTVGEVVQIASDQFLTWAQIYQMTGEVLGKSVELVTASADLIYSYDPEIGATLLGDKAYSYLFDISKLRKFVPGFKVKISFAEGVKRSAQYYLDHASEFQPKQIINELMDKIIAHVRSEVG